MKLLWIAFATSASALHQPHAPVAQPPKLLQQQQQILSRRGAFGAAAAAVAASLVPTTAAAAPDQSSIYFGVGCFWHVQHEFIEAEKTILGRGERDYTALAGYAGGTKLGVDTNRPGNKLVCYHNLQQIADYGRLGHGEVVGMTVPSDKVVDFSKVYFSLFDRGGDRPDKGDRGPEYRSLMGLPGGMDNPSFDKIQALASDAGLQLQKGAGDDPDTLGKRKVWVMDTASFPFYQGEVYHQYHDGFFPGEDYPPSYNLLQTKFAQAGVLKTTGCPDTRI